MTDKELDDLDARGRKLAGTLIIIGDTLALEAENGPDEKTRHDFFEGRAADDVFRLLTAIAELRKKNAGLVGALEEIRDELLPLSREAPERALAQIGVVANRAAKGLSPALKENTQ